MERLLRTLDHPSKILKGRCHKKLYASKLCDVYIIAEVRNQYDIDIIIEKLKQRGIFLAFPSHRLPCLRHVIGSKELRKATSHSHLYAKVASRLRPLRTLFSVMNGV